MTSQPNDAATQAAMKRFAQLWVSAQTTVAAYVHAAVRDPHEAEDVLGKVAEAAVEAFDQYDATRSFTGWLLGIARHRVLHHLRTRRRDRHVFDDQTLQLLAAAHERLDDQQSDRREALAGCIDNLPPHQKRMIQMRYDEAMNPRTMAQQLKMRPNAVEVALHRIRHALAQCIRQRLGAGEMR